jgi:hypothetical protein
MKAVVVSAAMLSVLTATASYAATEAGAASRAAPQAEVPAAEGAPGGQGVKVAGLAASTFLFVPDAAQSHLVTVGEGGEGRRGRKWRRGHHSYYIRREYHYFYDRPVYGRPYHGRPYYDRPSYRRPYGY